ncbi:MAG: methyltransferase [Saprospiraceae bacterium]
MELPFQFKQFSIDQQDSPFKVGTDGLLLGAWADFTDDESILDLGSGTGLIALMAAQRNSAAKIIGLEPSEIAFSNLLKNFKASKWSSRLESIHLSWQEYLGNKQGKIDHIVCNPPFFISGQQKQDDDQANARHTNTLSIEDICLGAQQILAPNGKLSMIFPFEQLETNLELFSLAGLYPKRICLARSRPKKPFHRSLVQVQNSPNWLIEQSDMTLLEAKGYQRSNEFEALTKDFLLD